MEKKKTKKDESLKSVDIESEDDFPLWLRNPYDSANREGFLILSDKKGGIAGRSYTAAIPEKNTYISNGCSSNIPSKETFIIGNGCSSNVPQAGMYLKMGKTRRLTASEKEELAIIRRKMHEEIT